MRPNAVWSLCCLLIMAIFNLACNSKRWVFGNEVTFSGMCDASGAVPISDSSFAIADDEQNILHVYDAKKGGAPLHSYDLSRILKMPLRPPKKLGKPPKPPAELDIEAAAIIGDTAYWITSHGLSSSGKRKAARLYFFATKIDQEKKKLSLVGSPYFGLLDALIGDKRFVSFQLDKAVTIAPKSPGGLNIEGMAAGKNGVLWIGFRNPIPGGKALLFTLKNPKAILYGAQPELGNPLLLDLKDRGVRALSYWRGYQLIVAGTFDGRGVSTLYALQETDNQLRPVMNFDHADFNPEAFFTPESQDKMMIISDDGSVLVGGTPCKKLMDVRRQHFRGRWIPFSSIAL